MYYYIIIFALLFIAELFYFKVADHFNIIDKPNERSSHTHLTLRGGGIIFYLGALVYFVFSGFHDLCFFIGLSLIAVISFVDDVHSVSSRVRLLVHFIAMLLLFWQWDMLDFPWWYLIIALVVCTGIINAYNFMDGINGITGGYSLVVLLTLAFINSYITSFTENRFLLTVMASVLVFNFFNFRKIAKCFAGDVGSVSMAFIILFFIGKLILVSSNFGYIVLLSVYGVDSVLTIIHRLMLRENISLPHRKHLYQIMANELKIPHVVVSGIYMLVQMIISVFFVPFLSHSYLYLLVVICCLSLIYAVFMRKYFYLHVSKNAAF
jgi:UDP-N-acetylmuramyl pentapeptide phosphotransferase/UDP-N-acetylglucosamine-1-phosphate transferase